MTGHVRKGSDIDLHLFSDSIEAITNMLESEGLQFGVERKQVVKHNESRIFTHIHVRDRFNFELTVYAADMAHYIFRSSITGKAIERASIAELEELIQREYPDVNIDEEIISQEESIDPYQMFRLLLQPLESVKQSPKYHPEGDVLYHSLQVFELAREARPYDEEFLLAALLHDVGKGIDPHDHVAAAVQALEGFITDRTRFLIEHHMQGLEYKSGTLARPATPSSRRIARLRGLDVAAGVRHRRTRAGSDGRDRRRGTRLFAGTGTPKRLIASRSRRRHSSAGGDFSPAAHGPGQNTMNRNSKIDGPNAASNTMGDSNRPATNTNNVSKTPRTLTPSVIKCLIEDRSRIPWPETAT